MRLIIVCCFLLLGACHQDAQKQQLMYDFAAFFKQEMALLKQTVHQVKKVYVYDNHTDSVVISNFDIAKELKEFTDIDLTKPVYANAFRQNKIQPHPDTIIVSFISTDPSIDLKQVDLTWFQQDVCQMKFYYQETNNLYESAKELIYQKGLGYEISGFQRTKLRNPVQYKIAVTYLK